MLFGIDLKNDQFDKNMKENSKRLHGQVNKYLQDRKNGVTKSQMDGSDLLAVYLEDTTMFDDECIIGGIINNIFAGIETTQYSLQTVVTNLIRNKHCIDKLRQEFDKQVQQPCIDEQPELAKLSKFDFLNKHLTIDQAFELDYCNYVMLEALRIMPPVMNSQS